ncbi:MAG: WecB/TagA/CpsF family glycosyltransferase [Candidatus Margulisbacteria bacterium]|nr:WecB/TagA/CpsF family glycosyltransferase [Candidatus Margulisiibacteriota bacterium]
METTVDFAGIKVDNVTLTEAAEIVRHFIIEGKPRVVVTPNPEMIVAAQTDAGFKKLINSADLRVADGISMVVVSRILGRPLKERVSGIDLMLKLLEIGADYNYRVFLLGGAPGVAEEAAKNIKDKFPGLVIAGVQNGYFNASDETGVVKKIKESDPDLLFVGLGAGRQEQWLNRHLYELGAGVGMTIGGSLDVLSGRKQRAPKWVQALYIEWLYRLITEPQRWKRQLALPKFLWLMFKPSV